MTDLASLTLPTWAVPSQPRQAAVNEHIVRIRTQWWREAITSRGLPGMSPVGPTPTRAQVWMTTGDVFTLLWQTLACGSGSHLRQNSRQLDSIAADVSRAEKLLTAAAEASRHDPASSVRFGVALGRLERLRELVSEYSPATGAWHYNGQVTYWARTPPPDRRRKSWTDYCAEIGRSPEWTDRHGLRTP